MTDLLHDLEPITAFPTTDEMHAFAGKLAAEHPDRVSLREVGRSRDGDQIQLLSIAASRPRGDVMVIGQPHPNEPIGMATIVALCRRLTADTDALDATGATWHFLPCVDPDGTRLNEGWFAGPWTRRHYARHFYRPGPETQVEWTFPFSTDGFSVDAPMPETRALMAAIDEVRPAVIASLHNAELGGAYFYVTSGDETLFTALADLCAANGVPLHRGELDTPLSAELAPAVFTVPTAQDLYQMATAAGVDPTGFVSGGSSLDYARRHGDPFGLAIELPYWRDPRAADDTPDPSGVSRRDAVVAGLDREEATFARLRALYDAAAPLPDSPFRDAIASFLRLGENGHTQAQREAVLADPSYQRPATVAEAFSAADNGHMVRLRMAGMLLRAVPRDAAAYRDVEATFEQWCAEAEADDRAEPIPIANLVAVQGGAILAAARHALSR